MIKRGYKKGAKTLEIIEGNVDVVLYNEKGNSFYFFRFQPNEVFPDQNHGITKRTNILYREDIEPFLGQFGRDYEGLINELIQRAVDSGMEERYEM